MFTTIAAPSVRMTQPADGATNAQRYGATIYFATPMDPKSLEGKIRVSGLTDDQRENAVDTSEGSVSVNVPFKSTTHYTVTLLPGATDRYGQVLGGYAFSFTTAEPTASVSLALPGYSSQALYSSTAEPILYYQTTNLPTVEFTLWPLTADEGRRLMHNFSFAYPKYNPSLPALRTLSETTRGPKDDVALGSTSRSRGG